MKVSILASEHQEQVNLCHWLSLKRLTFVATPNGGKRSMSEAKRFKAEGVKRGFPDITVFLPDKVLFIEMKRVKNSTTSKEQREWVKYLDSLPYSNSKVCKGFKEAKEYVEEML